MLIFRLGLLTSPLRQVLQTKVGFTYVFRLVWQTFGMTMWYYFRIKEKAQPNLSRCVPSFSDIRWQRGTVHK